ncbi:MAG TPA: ParB/RepB/Spo0J family partition protein [Thermoleophilaceae bacterium]|nr:ParB/RepB/Spo0J family partition protein [Thermoleophilaceae bacterium]
MSDDTTAVVDIDKITVEDRHNPRSSFDDASLAELEASIRKQGVVTALTVREDGDGGYIVVAGERRLLAAKGAGLTRVPVLIRPGDDALAAAIAENLIRRDLDVIEEAEALTRLAKAENLTTHKAIGARVGKSANWVSERLRLLKLPAGVQRHIAAGHVPVAAERDLREVAKVSPRIAECMCEYVVRKEIDGRDVLNRFGDILVSTASESFDPAPTMIELDWSMPLSELVEPGENRDALIVRVQKALDPSYGDSPQEGDDPWVDIDEADVDATRAAGCLLEHTTESQWSDDTRMFVTDREFLADLAERIVERVERECAEATSPERIAPDPSDSPSGAGNDVERERRAQAREDAKAARPGNLTLGNKLIGRRGGKVRSSQALARAKAIAAIVLHDNQDMPADGLRLVLPQLQEVTVRKLKTRNETREDVEYADSQRALDYLKGAIERAKSANEVLELLGEALVAAYLADERELPQYKRVKWSNYAMREAVELLSADIKAVSPDDAAPQD